MPPVNGIVPSSTFWIPGDRSTYHQAYPSMDFLEYAKHNEKAKELGQTFKKGQEYYDDFMAEWRRDHPDLVAKVKTPEELNEILIQAVQEAKETLPGDPLSWKLIQEIFGKICCFKPEKQELESWYEELKNQGKAKPIDIVEWRFKSGYHATGANNVAALKGALLACVKRVIDVSKADPSLYTWEKVDDLFSRLCHFHLGYQRMMDWYEEMYTQQRAQPFTPASQHSIADTFATSTTGTSSNIINSFSSLTITSATNLSNKDLLPEIRFRPLLTTDLSNTTYPKFPTQGFRELHRSRGFKWFVTQLDNFCKSAKKDSYSNEIIQAAWAGLVISKWRIWADGDLTKGDKDYLKKSFGGIDFEAKKNALIDAIEQALATDLSFRGSK